MVNVLAGPGSELAQALVTHPGIDLISLTGGVATGRAVMAAAAPRLTPVLLELGGNDTAIIASDITVNDELVERLVTATYTTGGQVCMAIEKRLYAPTQRVGELAEAVLARCGREVVATASLRRRRWARCTTPPAATGWPRWSPTPRHRARRLEPRDGSATRTPTRGESGAADRRH